MKEQLAKRLYEKYPLLFANLKGYDLSCDDGWYSLLDEVCKEVTEKISIKDQEGFFEQIKEKFGGLRMYFKGMQGSDSFEIAYQITDKAEKKSITTCEICGEIGQMCSRNGWLKTVCEKHMKEGGFTQTNFKMVTI